MRSCVSRRHEFDRIEYTISQNDMKPKNLRDKILAAEKILHEDAATKDKFESLQKLLRGANPQVDKALDAVSDAWDKLERFQDGDHVHLTAEHMPEKNEKQKKRKKALLLFIRRWKNLKKEVKRFQGAVESGQEDMSNEARAETFGRKAMSVKGITGALALVVLGVVLVGSALNGDADTPQDAAPTPSETIEVLVFDGHEIPLSEVKVVTGLECDGQPHYHIVEGFTVTALDGEQLEDPNPAGCGFGVEGEVEVISVSIDE